MPEGDDFGENQRHAIKAALAELLAWEDLQRSPHLAAFLSYVVQARLKGEAGSIKAYSIAVDVFGRNEGFDPQSDPIVRVQARRLRSLLAIFDASGLRTSSVRIMLPVGRYVPEFTFDADANTLPDGPNRTLFFGSKHQAHEELPSSPDRTVWFLGGAAAFVLAAALVFWQSLSLPTGALGTTQPKIPTVLVQEFQNLTADQRGEPLVAGLAVELVTDFNQFPDIMARYGGSQQNLSDQAPADFVLSGVVRRIVDGIQYVALLQNKDGETIGEPLDILVPMEGPLPGLSLDDIALRIVLRLASPRGPIHAPARAWIESEASRDTLLEFYPCLVAFHAYRELRSPEDEQRVSACATHASQDGGQQAIGHAMLAALAADRSWDAGAETETGEDHMAIARRHLEDAMRYDQLDGLVWSLLAQVALNEGDRLRARDYYNSAIQLNPGSVDTVASYANLLGLAGSWQAALDYSELAFEAEDDPPVRYHIVPALYALRSGDYDSAIVHGTEMRKAVPDFGSAVLVAAGALSRRNDVVNENLARVMSSPRFRRLGIMPALRQQTSDTDLLRQLGTGLGQAGLTLDRLAQPF